MTCNGKLEVGSGTERSIRILLLHIVSLRLRVIFFTTKDSNYLPSLLSPWISQNLYYVQFYITVVPQIWCSKCFQWRRTQYVLYKLMLLFSLLLYKSYKADFQAQQDEFRWHLYFSSDTSFRNVWYFHIRVCSVLDGFYSYSLMYSNKCMHSFELVFC